MVFYSFSQLAFQRSNVGVDVVQCDDDHDDDYDDEKMIKLWKYGR